MAREVWDSARLHVAGEICFDAYRVFAEIIDQRFIFHCAHVVTNAFRAQNFDRIPDTVWASAFARVNRHAPASLFSAAKMVFKKARRKFRLVARQIQGCDFLSLREQSVQLLRRRFGTVRSAENTDEVY